MKRVPIETHHRALNMKIAGLRFLGIWSLRSSVPSSLKFLYYLYSKLALTTIIIFAGTMATDLVFNYNNLFIVTDDGCYLAGISVIIFKLHVYQSKHDRISKLVNAIHESVHVLRESSDLGIQTAVNQCIFFEDLTGKFFLCLGSVLAILLLFFVPKEQGALPIRAVFPFDTSSSPMYELAFSVQAFSVTYGLLTIVLMDELVITLIRWITVQLSILGSNYEKCKQNAIADSSNDTFNVEITNHSGAINVNMNTMAIRSFVPLGKQELEEMNDSFTWRFVNCAKHHQRFICIIDELNAIFGSSMLLQLFSSFSMICLTAFQAALGTASKRSLMKFVVYLGAACSQLVNWCWFGNQLFYQSASLSTSQWLCGWETMALSDIKSFMIISLICTKQPLQLKAGKFFNMSLQTFISVLRNSYSFFTLLTHVSANK